METKPVLTRTEFALVGLSAVMLVVTTVIMFSNEPSYATAAPVAGYLGVGAGAIVHAVVRHRLPEVCRPVWYGIGAAIAVWVCSAVLLAVFF